jgi:hypothetical protein
MVLSLIAVQALYSGVRIQASRLAEAVTLLTCIQEVRGSTLGQNTLFLQHHEHNYLIFIVSSYPLHVSILCLGHPQVVFTLKHQSVVWSDSSDD